MDSKERIEWKPGDHATYGSVPVVIKRVNKRSVRVSFYDLHDRILHATVRSKELLKRRT